MLRFIQLELEINNLKELKYIKYMKIYLILNCTCPNIKELSKTLKEKNFNKYLHISNCHTVATVWNIISGKRTTDLLNGLS